DGQDTIVNTGNSSKSGTLDFGNIAANQLWFLKSGNDLKIDVMGSTQQVTVSGWFNSAGAQLQSITAGGLTLDTQVNALVQSMATYSAAHSGFNPAASASTQAPNDTALQ